MSMNSITQNPKNAIGSIGLSLITLLLFSQSQKVKDFFHETTFENPVGSFSKQHTAQTNLPSYAKLTAAASPAFQDSDGDGIFNYIDVDDDNDGIPDDIEQSNAASSVLSGQVSVTLLNETFGVGTTRGRIYDNVPTASTTYCYEDGTTAQAADECDTNKDLNDGQYTINDQAGTTAVASWAPSYWYQGVDHTTADTNGKMALFNATPVITDEFYRTIVQGVIANAPLTYSFWVLNLDRSDAPGIGSRYRPNLTVEFRDLSNNLLNTITTGNIPPTTAGNLSGDWYQFSATFIPTTSSVSIIFKNNQVGGTGNDLALDDITITQSLVDSDQDNVADVYDLDSDNDGVGDIIEDRWNAFSFGYDRMDLTPAVWLDVNGNGWHDTPEAWYASNTSADFDGDSVPNYLDLDSDNDALFDVDEAGMYYGDGDINCDGEGEGTDSDQDGILSMFDTYSGFGNLGKALPLDTLSSGNPDFLNVQSNSGVYDINTTLFASLDSNNDGIIDGNADIDRDGIRDTFDTDTNYFGSPRDLNRKLYLDFDGRNDYGQGSSILGGLSNASLMGWINLNSAFSSEGMVMGQNRFNIHITTARKLAAVVNGTTLTCDTNILNTAQWYHVGAVYGGGLLKLFLNGEMVASTTASGSIAADATALTIGKDPSLSTKYFKGKIDELRVFNVALTDEQFQRMVYQEIQNTASQVRGAVIPKDIGALPFANLLRYYRMDVYKNDIIDDLSTPGFDTGTGMKIYNNKTINVQQAPMPFVTERAGDFATAVNSPTNEIRGMDIMDQDWSIVQVKHNISETSDNTDLGMIVDPAITVTMNNDTKIQNDWYLQLDGKIDLQGKSQLVQTTNSDLEVSSSGWMERDQQGQANKFNYNYWSSPVGAINSSSNNTQYTVDQVLRDGTDPNDIHSITWTPGYDSAPTTPITLSSYWIFKFQNLSPVYANWEAVGQNGTLAAGQGFTMKGIDNGQESQNYTFVGKPNNGTISIPIAANNLNLCGNPYASALDADDFIVDNLTATTGAIYFWEHYNTNPSHILLEYQGGYAVRNLIGGIPPVSPAGISGLGTSTRIPSRYIPVGQGFLMYGSTVGGDIIFNNNQRNFVKETDVNSNILFRQNTDTIANNTQKEIHERRRRSSAKIRLGFTSPNGYHKQILLGFMNELASAGIDKGYDAPQLDNLSNDMCFINNNVKLSIQGDGFFNRFRIFPLSVKIDSEGVVKFTLDGVENLESNQKIYIYDAITNEYYNIKNEPYTVSLQVGNFDNRFSLCFKRNAYTSNKIENSSSLDVSLVNNDKSIIISKIDADTALQSATLYNMLGQFIAEWKLNDSNQVEVVQIPVNDISQGTYIIKVKTSSGNVTKKVIIQ